MSTTKEKVTHTPGPWTVIEDSLGCFVRAPKTPKQEKYGLLGYSLCAMTGYKEPDETVMANARLIAAAPEMYKESRAVIDAFFDEYEHEESAPENSPTVQAIRRLRAAIRKARGGE